MIILSVQSAGITTLKDGMSFPEENEAFEEIHDESDTELESLASDDEDLADQDSDEALADEQSEATEELRGAELVDSLLKRQDEVLLQLDDLNARVEAKIKELTDARKAEIAAAELEDAQHSNEEVANDVAEPLRKAA